MAKKDQVKNLVLILSLVAAVACNIRVHHEQILIKNSKIQQDTCQTISSPK